MLTFSDRFWKQKEQKNDICCLELPNNKYTYQEIEKHILGLMSRLYSLGVSSNSLVAIQHNCIEGIFVEWAIWLLGGGIVYWDESVDIEKIFANLEEKKVSHLIIQNEQFFVDHEDYIDELYDLIHVLCLQDSEHIVPITPASYDNRHKVFLQNYKTNSIENIALFHITEDRNDIVLHQELYNSSFQMHPTFSIYFPISRLAELRRFLAQHIFEHRIVCYQQNSIPYTYMDFCIVDEDFLQHILVRLQNTKPTIFWGRYLVKWYSLLLQQLLLQQHLSKRIHIQLQMIQFFSVFFVKESMGISQVAVLKKDSILQHKLGILGVSIYYIP